MCPQETGVGMAMVLEMGGADYYGQDRHCPRCQTE